MTEPTLDTPTQRLDRLERARRRGVALFRARTLRSVALVVAVGVGACATTGLTPAQSRVLDQFNACQHEGPTVQLSRLGVDGRFTLTGRHVDIALTKRCLSERFGYERWGDPRIQEEPVEPGGGM